MYILGIGPKLPTKSLPCLDVLEQRLAGHGRKRLDVCDGHFKLLYQLHVARQGTAGQLGILLGGLLWWCRPFQVQVARSCHVSVPSFASIVIRINVHSWQACLWLYRDVLLKHHYINVRPDEKCLRRLVPVYLRGRLSTRR